MHQATLDIPGGWNYATHTLLYFFPTRGVCPRFVDEREHTAQLQGSSLDVAGSALIVPNCPFVRPKGFELGSQMEHALGSYDIVLGLT